jgi:hypothetical protein
VVCAPEEVVFIRFRRQKISTSRFPLVSLRWVPDFTWSNDASWARLLDFKLDEVPELNIARLPRGI